MGLHRSTVYYVTQGRRRSARIESEIARILGKADWNEVVLEARSAVTGKPAAVLAREIARKREASRKAAMERAFAFAASVHDESFQYMPPADGGAAKGKRRAG